MEKMPVFKMGKVIFLIWVLALAGCGYTQKTVLPENIKTIHVDTVKNKLVVTEMYAYQPGLEMDITNAVIRHLQADGNLKVVEKEKADAILQTDLEAYEQEGLRFNNLESVQEYRLFIVVHLKLVNAKTGNTILDEPNFSGQTEYYVSGVRSIGEQAAAQQAIENLAKNIVDRIVQDW